MRRLMVLGLALAMIVPAGARAQPASSEQAVSFQGSGGVPIAGSIVLPAGADAAHRAPAMLLLQGSGPVDRDGNQPPSFRTDLLPQVAEILAGQGIATLRFDKRGMYANRATMPKQAEELPAFFSWEAFVGDARAAFAFLAAHPAVAPDRVGVLGHSEGGLLALELGQGGSSRPKLLVLAAAAGRPLGDVIHDQLEALLERQHATPEQRKFFLDADARIRAEILATGKVPLDVPAGLAALYPSYLGPFYKSVLAIDPAALAAAYRGPMLIINGRADTQISATRDAARFAALLASRHDGSEVFTPDAVSHNLKHVGNGDDPGIAGPIDPGVKETIQRWLKATF